MAPSAPLAQIVDAVHESGNQHFYWLPPLVRQPTVSGVFDPSLSPVVEICEWTSVDCVLPLVVRFTTSGQGSERVRVDTEDEHYIVNWHTKRFALNPAKIYRIRVLVDDLELGHAEVDVVGSGRELRDVDQDQYVPLLNGRTLPIKFRIEAGAIPPVTEWIQLLPTGTLPAIRGGHTAVLDQTSNRLIAFGGRAAGSLVSEVWVLTNANGLGGAPAWIQLAPTGGPPPGRIGHSAVFDASTNRMIVYAGTTENFRLDDAWVLTNANGTEPGTSTWMQLAPGPGPTPRAGHSAAYDPSSNRMIVFGGELSGVLSDLWILTNANGTDVATPTWVQVSPSGTTPAARTGAAAAFDFSNNRMIMFGGSLTGGCDPNNETWVLRNANGLIGQPEWSQLTPAGIAPEAHLVPTVGYRSGTNRLIVFSGFDGATCVPNVSDTWLLDGANGTGSAGWSELFPSGGPPPPRVAYTSDSYDEIVNRLVVFGGTTGANPTGSTDFLNDVWVLVNADGSP
jgi:hypothetical protein